MLHQKLISPSSIAIIGGSEDTHKPGGKLVSNLKSCNFKGEIFIVNPKESQVQGLKCFRSAKELPPVDLAIIAIPAQYTFDIVRILALEKGTRGFIIISAGFSEVNSEGAKLEKQIVDIVKQVEGTLIGPNCIGVVNQNYSGIFTSPVPILDPFGCDFISSSGSTAVFIIESAMPKGLTFSSVYSVGNSPQTGVEEVLEFFDESFDPQKSSRVKLLFIESIRNPDKLLKHASSLIQKGCHIASVKAGGSEAGSRAASFHTGALANSDLAVEALFRKAGIVRCYGREELTTVASVFMHKEMKGKRIAIITHAGGPAVMLTDALSEGGMEVQSLEGKESEELLSQLPVGSSVKNPIDFLATGNAKHLETIIDYCDKKFDNIDAMIVIFGSTGLHKVYDVYEILHRKIQSSSKPIFPILPSVLTAQKEVDCFLSQGHINFPDEVTLGKALAKVYNTPKPAEKTIIFDGIQLSNVRKLIDETNDGLMEPEDIQRLLSSAGISIVDGKIIKDEDSLIHIARQIGFPLVLKAVGPVHKSDVGGVVLNIKDERHLLADFNRLMKIPGSQSVLLQPMLSGIELFIGAKYETAFGHIILVGLGGIFVEVLGDVSSGLAPLTYNEAYSMIRSLKSYKIIKGMRGQKGINEDKLAEIIVRLSTILRFATEIKELDLNPLLGTMDDIVVVDARIRLDKNRN